MITLSKVGQGCDTADAFLLCSFLNDRRDGGVHGGCVFSPPPYPLQAIAPTTLKGSTMKEPQRFEADVKPNVESTIDLPYEVLHRAAESVARSGVALEKKLRASFAVFTYGTAVAISEMHPECVLAEARVALGTHITSITTTTGDSATRVPGDQIYSALKDAALNRDLKMLRLHTAVRCYVIPDPEQADSAPCVLIRGRVHRTEERCVLRPIHPLLFSTKERGVRDAEVKWNACVAMDEPLYHGQLVSFQVCSRDGGLVARCVSAPTHCLSEVSTRVVSFYSINNLGERSLIEFFSGTPEQRRNGLRRRSRSGENILLAPRQSCHTGLLKKAAAEAKQAATGFSAAARHGRICSMHYTKNGNNAAAFDQIVIREVYLQRGSAKYCYAVHMPAINKTVRMPENKSFAVSLLKEIVQAAEGCGVSIRYDVKLDIPKTPSQKSVVRRLEKTELRIVRNSIPSRSYSVTNAWALSNPQLEYEFRESEHILRDRLGGATQVEMLRAFHGTAESNVISIMKFGFDPNRRCGQAYGEGEYFARDPEVAVGYAAGSPYLLVCDLLLGKRGDDFKYEEGIGYYVINQRAGMVLCLPRYIVQLTGVPPSWMGEVTSTLHLQLPTEAAAARVHRSDVASEVAQFVPTHSFLTNVTLLSRDNPKNDAIFNEVKGRAGKVRGIAQISVAQEWCDAHDACRFACSTSGASVEKELWLFSAQGDAGESTDFASFLRDGGVWKVPEITSGALGEGIYLTNNVRSACGKKWMDALEGGEGEGEGGGDAESATTPPRPLTVLFRCRAVFTGLSPKVYDSGIYRAESHAHILPLYAVAIQPFPTTKTAAWTKEHTPSAVFERVAG